jgi:hypothetical protein
MFPACEKAENKAGPRACRFLESVDNLIVRKNGFKINDKVADANRIGIKDDFLERLGAARLLIKCPDVEWRPLCLTGLAADHNARGGYGS